MSLLRTVYHWIKKKLHSICCCRKIKKTAKLRVKTTLEPIELSNFYSPLEYKTPPSLRQFFAGIEEHRKKEIDSPTADPEMLENSKRHFTEPLLPVNQCDIVHLSPENR